MAAQAFIKASDAAVIGGVSVASLGCSSGNEFPTKAGIVGSGGSFDYSRLENYDDEDFVLENDVVLGEQLVELQFDPDVQSRGNVQLNDGSVATSIAVMCTQGQNVTAKCILTDPLDVFLGWYDDEDNLVSENKNYTFTVTGPVSLTAKIAWMTVNKNSILAAWSGLETSFVVSGNVNWVIQ